MIIALIGKNKIYRVTLPDIPSGDYWISDEQDRKLMNFRMIDGKCYTSSSAIIRIINPNKLNANNSNYFDKANDGAVIQECSIDLYKIMYVAVKGYDELFVLYSLPTCEKLTKYNINNSLEITIGKGADCNIQIDSPIVKEKHARIYYSGTQLMLENYDKNYGTFINNRPAGEYSRLLFNGDVIFVMGLKIVIMGKSIFVNNPQGKVRLDSRRFTKADEQPQIINQEDTDDENVQIYSEDDYFLRSPRITNIIEREKVKIDEPPQIQSKEGMPFIYVIGTTLSMGAISLLSGFTTMQSLIQGRTTAEEALPSILITFTMLLSTILIPIMNNRYDKNQKKIYEQTRQKRYREYLNSKMKQVEKIMEKQKRILFENYVSTEECSKIIMTRNPRLWERKIDDEDFLTFRLGIGDVPLQIDIEYPEKHFTMEDDDLVEMLNEFGKNSKTLKDAPITVSLAKSNISALVVRNNYRLIEKFIQSMILQLITFHSYDDLKIVFLAGKENKKMWDRMKMLPHTWNEAKQIRFFAYDYNDMKEISQYLEEDLKHRQEATGVDLDYRSFKPYYLIITDDYKSIRNLNFINEIVKGKGNLGYSLFCITDNIAELPDECKTFITLNEDSGVVFESELSSTNKIPFNFDSSYTFFFENISKEISDIPIREVKSGKGMLPESYSFLEMYDVGRIEQLNTLQRWRTNDTSLSLAAPVGIDSNGMIISLDVHEKFHGPHGLIAGSTGSGKSEFIITYILSLAINYHPYDVSFVLIDYKGGGLAGAFEKKDIRLPHLIGTITNIETSELQRSLASIKSELRRRQVIFNEARDNTDEGTIDIYKYQKLYHEGLVKEPIPHLLIICDEFAELKQQQEDFMDELISVARIGRSLGVHLILATQKPAGVVNDQIRSNSKFGICLKVQEREDSIDVIKRPEAADLKRAGQFYMQVGNNEYFVLGQSGWAGAQYYPSDTVKKKVDTSIKFISNIGNVIKKVDTSKKDLLTSSGEQLTNIVKYLDELAKSENIERRSLWVESIPETIYAEDIKKKYKITDNKNQISPVIGEYDDPDNQRQGPVLLDISNGGNTAIFGSSDSGKETLLSTMCYEIMLKHSPDEAQLYIFDFGSEALKAFSKSPNVGDVVFSNDDEKVRRFFDFMQKEMKRRISILSDYGGSYDLYVKSGNEPMPLITVIINNYEAFSELYEDEYDDLLLTLTRDGVKYGIVFVITVSGYNDIRYRMAQNFKQKIALQMNNEDDYINIWDGVGKKKPASIFGRGLIKLDNIYEFQVAKICPAESWNKHIKETIDKLNESAKTFANPIPVLPEKVTVNDLKDEVGDLKELPIGIEVNSLNVARYNFKKNIINIITSKSLDISAEFTLHILEEIKLLRGIDTVIFDAEGIAMSKTGNLAEDYNNFLQGLRNDKGEKHIVCAIFGIEKFLNAIEGEFEEALNLASEYGNCSFIIVDSLARFKNHEYDEWYKNYFTGDSGIWVGRGMQDQYLINYSIGTNKIDNNCKNSFGYAISGGEPLMVKLLGMEE